MKSAKITLATILLVLLNAATHAQQLFTSQTQLPGTNSGGNVAACADRGVGIIGICAGGNLKSVFMTKLNTQGAQDWSINIARVTPQSYFVNPDITATADSGFIISAVDTLYDTTVVAKINKAGNLVWNRNFYFSHTARVFATNDGGALVVKAYKLQNIVRAAVLKMDAAGQQQWDQEYSFSGVNFNQGILSVASVNEDAAGNISLLFNYIISQQHDIMLLKLLPNGTLLYQKRYSTPNANSRLTALQSRTSLNGNTDILFGSIGGLFNSSRVGKWK